MSEVIINNGAGNRILPGFSWSSALAGSLIAIVTYIAFMLLGGALGLSIMSFEGGINLSAAGWGTGIFWIIFSSISIAFGAYIAGRLTQNVSGFAGGMNGLLDWALLSVVNISFTANTAGTVAGAAGSVVEGAAGTVESTLGGLSQIDIEANVGAMLGIENLDDLEKRIDEIEAPRVKAVIQEEFTLVQANLREAAIAILRNPDVADSQIKELKSEIRSSLNTIDRELTPQKLNEVIADNTNLSEAEAAQVASEWRGEFNDIMANVDRNIAQLEQRAEEFANEATATADDAADGIATFMGILFVLFAVGFFVSIIFGRMGARSARVALA